jgi:hypothetical protein
MSVCMGIGPGVIICVRMGRGEPGLVVGPLVGRMLDILYG